MAQSTSIAIAQNLPRSNEKGEQRQGVKMKEDQRLLCTSLRYYHNNRRRNYKQQEDFSKRPRVDDSKGDDYRMDYIFTIPQEQIQAKKKKPKHFVLTNSSVDSKSYEGHEQILCISQRLWSHDSKMWESIWANKGINEEWKLVGISKGKNP